MAESSRHDDRGEARHRGEASARGDGGARGEARDRASFHRRSAPSAEQGSSVNDRGSLPLDDLYREVVLDHYRNPRGRKAISQPGVSVEGFNPTCGDQVHLVVAMENDRIAETQVECRGCSISVASGSMMAEMVRGRTREEVERLIEGFKGMMQGRSSDPDLDLGDLEALEGVRKFPVRVKCALLAWTTLREALDRGPHDSSQADDWKKGP